MFALSTSSPLTSTIFFILVVVFGALFVMNLYVVVMCESYLRTRETLQELEDRAAQHAADAKKVREATRRQRLRMSGKPQKKSAAELAAAWLGQLEAMLKRRVDGLRSRLHMAMRTPRRPSKRNPKRAYG